MSRASSARTRKFRPSRPSRFSRLIAGKWVQAFSMCFFLLAGVAFAIGHHAYYRNANGKDAEDQLKLRRYGTALAFLAKASLVTAVVLAFRQRVWMMVRRKMLSLATIDSLFAATEDLTALLSWEAMKSAKLAMCLAAYVWATPLMVILTSETLSVVPETKRQAGLCPNIHTLNFTHEEALDYRHPVRIDGLISTSVSIWNTTFEGNIKKGPDSFDYWTSSSQQVREAATKTLYLQKAPVRNNASQEICSPGWNCSYTISFTAPGYKCEELAVGANAAARKLNGVLPPFTTNQILPLGNLSYIAVADEGEYASWQIDSKGGGIPTQKPPYPRSLGAFKTEPIIWVGYAAVDDPSKTQPNNDTDPDWYKAFTPTIFGCQHYKTNYTVQFTYRNQIQTYKVLKRDFIEKVIDTRFIRDKKDDQDGTWDNSTAIPRRNHVLAQNLAKYRHTAAYHSLGYLLREFINGTIEMPNYISKTKATETRLINKRNYLPVKHFQDQVQEFYQEIIFGLLASPLFGVVSWANDPSVPAGEVKDKPGTSYKCTRERTTNVYRYNETELWLVYAVSILIAFIGILSGVVAIHEEGVMRDTRFSSIVAATRAHSLNKVRWDEKHNVQGLKVGFGTVPGQAGETTQGFAFEGDVTQRAGKTMRSPVTHMMEWGNRSYDRRASRG